MTGFLSGSTQPLSTVTIGTLDDMGYGVTYGGADAYTLPGLPLVSPDDGPSYDGYFVNPEVEVGTATVANSLLGGDTSSLVAPIGYDIVINDGDVVTGKLVRYRADRRHRSDEPDHRTTTNRR